jgi:hypothetical protein
MSTPTSVYNLYFGGGGAPALQLDPSQLTVSEPMPLDKVDLSHVKGPGALVIQIGDQAVVVSLAIGSGGVPSNQTPEITVSGLDADSVDLSHVKGPALATRGADGSVTVGKL